MNSLGNCFLAVTFMDLEELKAISDELGYNIDDQLL
jgi:GGDEF domain-containing protein